nr:hypothetical protein GCM10020092_023430 [Actinoplanes digitatis]
MLSAGRATGGIASGVRKRSGRGTALVSSDPVPGPSAGRPQPASAATPAAPARPSRPRRDTPAVTRSCRAARAGAGRYAKAHQVSAEVRAMTVMPSGMCSPTCRAKPRPTCITIAHHSATLNAIGHHGPRPGRTSRIVAGSRAAEVSTSRIAFALCRPSSFTLPVTKPLSQGRLGEHLEQQDDGERTDDGDGPSAGGSDLWHEPIVGLRPVFRIRVRT